MNASAPALDAAATSFAIAHGFPDLRVLVVGDVLLDRYLVGSCSRISPEAPVPVVRLQSKRHSLGGAGNVAANLAALGVQAELAGLVGEDEGGRSVRSECERLGIEVAGLTSSSTWSTVTKTRIMAADHQIVRLDEEPEGEADDDKIAQLGSVVEDLISQGGLSCVILSDYGKGVCTSSFCRRIIRAAGGQGVPVYVDPKGGDIAKYRGASGIKPNRSEMLEIAQANGWGDGTLTNWATRLRNELDLDFVALTLGPGGIYLCDRESAGLLPTAAKEVFDVSGAGDTVISVMSAALGSGLGLAEATQLANLGAAEVVSHVGTVALTRGQLLSAVNEAGRGDRVGKLYDLDELLILVSAWREAGESVVFTNGCFDLLHSGHVRLLQDAGAMGDRLILAVNDDASITRLKGAARPIMREEQRTAVLSALQVVSAVVLFSSDTPLHLIEAVRPDVLVKGGDYKIENIVGAEVVQSSGGRVEIVPIIDQVSTTSLAAAVARL